jgi:hypothetical protein
VQSQLRVRIPQRGFIRAFVELDEDIGFCSKMSNKLLKLIITPSIETILNGFIDNNHNNNNNNNNNRNNNGNNNNPIIWPNKQQGKKDYR